jgi:DNA ligase 1
MNRFAELLDRLAYEPGRNNKLRLLTAYFRKVEDPDRGYALAALTGALSFKHAKPGLIRDLIADRTDPVLFALSYDYVGDLSETVALMWPKATSQAQPAPSPACWGGLGWGLFLRHNRRTRHPLRRMTTTAAARSERRVSPAPAAPRRFDARACVRSAAPPR